MADLGPQSLSPTNLGRVDEEMVPPAKRAFRASQSFTVSHKRLLHSAVLRNLWKVLRTSRFLGTLNPVSDSLLDEWLFWNFHTRGVLHGYWSGGGPVDVTSRLGTRFLEEGVRRKKSLPIGCWDVRIMAQVALATSPFSAQRGCSRRGQAPSDPASITAHR
ncbi:hypothetical protein TNCV_2591741 [Trichonephila clavipes]|nr:hypothetical protein TNCV_2591741 [Trichonephila clavipes]